MVVTSTNQEVQQQYELYDHYVPSRMEVIPPGVDFVIIFAARRRLASAADRQRVGIASFEIPTSR